MKVQLIAIDRGESGAEGWKNREQQQYRWSPNSTPSSGTERRGELTERMQNLDTERRMEKEKVRVELQGRECLDGPQPTLQTGATEQGGAVQGTVGEHRGDFR